VKKSERDKLLFLLAITSGSADGWAILGLGHAFVANMTGNTVLLGIGIFGMQSERTHPLIALIFYATGVAAGSLFTRHVKSDATWSRSVSFTLLFEALLLLLAEAAWIYLNGAPSRETSFILLACVAFAIGLQSGALLPLKLPGVITTYITGTWTTLVSGLVAIGGQAPSRESKEVVEERVVIQIGFLLTYFLAAVFTGLIFKYVPTMVGIVSSLPVLTVAIYGAIRG